MSDRPHSPAQDNSTPAEGEGIEMPPVPGGPPGGPETAEGDEASPNATGAMDPG